MSRAKRHMGRVAALPCLICEKCGLGDSPAEVHHVLAPRSDFLTIPLCPTHHRGALGFHGLGARAFERKYHTSEAELLAAPGGQADAGSGDQAVPADRRPRERGRPVSPQRQFTGEIMKPLVIYHGNCADGFGGAWVFSRHSGYPRDYFDYHPGTYQDAPPDVTGRDVYLVDFSYKRPVVEAMLEKAASVTLIDHHKTALDDLGPIMPRMRCHCGLDHSGAMLAWQFWTEGLQGPPPPLLAHIEDRDLWRFALPYTREIQANVFSHPYDFDVWDTLMGQPIEELVAEGKAIERKHFKDIAELVAAFKYHRSIGGYTVPVANLPYTLTSDAGHLMAQGHAFAACYWDTPQGRVYSLRSTDEGVDVSEVAKQYGGGGHRNAAGFRVPYTHPLGQPIPPGPEAVPRPLHHNPVG